MQESAQFEGRQMVLARVVLEGHSYAHTALKGSDKYM